MRTLSATLEAAQASSSIAALVKIVLTRSGEATKTYEEDRILDIKFPQSPYSQTAKVVLDNSDDALTDIDLKAYQGVISKGATTSGGAEYSAQPPLWVMGQTFDSSENRLTCTLDLIGIPDRMAKDKASVLYEPDDDDTETVKDLIDAIAGATIACYNHCQAYTVDWDSEDGLIDSHMPKSRFRVYVSDTRLDKIKELLEKTGCHMIIKADGHIHIFVPKVDTSTSWVADTAYSLRDRVIPTTPNNYVYICTTAGTSHASTEPTWPTDIGDTVSDGTVTWTVAYDYEYELAVSGQHTFFAKAYRQRLVIPNKVTVKSFVDEDDPYTGSATSAASYALMPVEEIVRMTLASDAEAGNVATAIIARYEMWCDAGVVEVPLNVGAEVLDFVHVIDSRNGDDRNGNIGQLTLNYKAGKQWSMTFSFGNWTTLEGILGRLGTSVTELQRYFTRLMVKNLYAETIIVEQLYVEYLSAIVADMGLLTAGEIRVGTGTLGVDFSGIRLGILADTDSGIDTDEALNDSETGIDCDADATSAIPVGTIIQIGYEVMYVTGTGTTLTVTRGYFGSVATTHETNQNIMICDSGVLWVYNNDAITVKLEDAGLKLYGQITYLYDVNANLRGYIYGNSVDGMTIGGVDESVNIYGSEILLAPSDTVRVTTSLIIPVL